jgi:hypothetical protein
MDGLYEGDWLDGHPEGKGHLTIKNVGSYTGEFKNGTINGLGTMNYINGKVYSGNW